MAKPLRVMRNAPVVSDPKLFETISKLASSVDSIKKEQQSHADTWTCTGYTDDKQYKFCTNVDGSTVDVASSAASSIGIIKGPNDVCFHGTTMLKVDNPCQVDDVLVPSSTGTGKKGTSDEILSCVISKVPIARVIAATSDPKLVLCTL